MNVSEASIANLAYVVRFDLVPVPGCGVMIQLFDAAGNSSFLSDDEGPCLFETEGLALAHARVGLLGVTQEGLAAMLELSRPTVARWESRSGSITLVQLYAFSHLVGLRGLPVVRSADM